jgi:hypothetical protein
MHKSKVEPEVEKDLSGLIAEFRSKKVSKVIKYTDDEFDRKFIPDLLVAIQGQLDRVGVGHGCVHVTYDLSVEEIVLRPDEKNITDQVLEGQFGKQMRLWVRDEVRSGLESYIQWSFEMLPLQRRIAFLQSEVERLKRDGLSERPSYPFVHPFFGPFGNR